MCVLLACWTPPGPGLVLLLCWPQRPRSAVAPALRTRPYHTGTPARPRLSTPAIFHPMPTAARRPAAAGYRWPASHPVTPSARPGMTHREEQSMRRRIKSTHIDADYFRLLGGVARLRNCAQTLPLCTALGRTAHPHRGYLAAPFVGCLWACAACTPKVSCTAPKSGRMGLTTLRSLAGACLQRCSSCLSSREASP